jgi:hypothetical protein
MSPTVSYFDNKYMTKDELNSICNSEEEDLIMEYSITNVTTERIRVVTNNFNSLTIQVEFEDDRAKILASTQAGDQYATFADNIETKVELEPCSTNISRIPFWIEHDENILFKIYKEGERPIALDEFYTRIGPIDFAIYSKSAIVKDEEE